MGGNDVMFSFYSLITVVAWGKKGSTRAGSLTYHTETV